MNGALPRQPLVGLSLSAIAGILVAEYVPISPGWIIAPAGVLAIAGWRWRGAIHVFVFAAFAVFHLLGARDSPGLRLAKQLESGSRTLIASGTIIDEPRETVTSRGETQFVFPLRLERVSIDGIDEKNSAILLVRWLGARPVYGDRVRLSGPAENLEPIRNPGQFDFAASMRRREIFSTIRMRSAGMEKFSRTTPGPRFTNSPSRPATGWSGRCHSASMTNRRMPD